MVTNNGEARAAWRWWFAGVVNRTTESNGIDDGRFCTGRRCVIGVRILLACKVPEDKLVGGVH